MSVVFDFIAFVFESLENLPYVEHDGQNLTIDILLLAPEREEIRNSPKIACVGGY